MRGSRLHSTHNRRGRARTGPAKPVGADAHGRGDEGRGDARRVAYKLQLRAEIKGLQTTAGVTGVLVTHDQIEAMTMADRIAVMNLGILQQVGPPQELYDRAENLFVAQFIGEPPMNLLPGILRSAGGKFAVEGTGWEVWLPPRAGW